MKNQQKCIDLAMEIQRGGWANGGGGSITNFYYKFSILIKL